MSEAQRVVLQEAVHCRKCGKLLEPGQVVRAYPRQGGWAYYCAERCGKPVGANPYPKPDGRPSQAQAPSPSPASPSPASPSPDLEALRKELVELRQAVEGITGALLSLVEVVNNHAVATGQWLDLVQKAIRESK